MKHKINKVNANALKGDIVMDKKDIKKVVLAYSGGLDTSIIIPWLKENYNNCEVIAVSGDVGQGTELDGLEEKAIATGASKLYILDLKDEYVEDYIFPCLKAGADYEKYLLGTSHARPCIAKGLAEIAKKEGADAICHGCTGKGNDQVRFELALKAFAPEMAIIAPWREWNITSREEEIEYAEAHNIPLKINRETNYSKDKNVWHLSHEGLDLEDPANEPQYLKDGFLELGVAPEKAPDEPTYITIHFEKGVPTAIDGKEMKALDIVETLNEIGGKNGIGLLGIVAIVFEVIVTSDISVYLVPENISPVVAVILVPASTEVCCEVLLVVVVDRSDCAIEVIAHLLAVYEVVLHLYRVQSKTGVVLIAVLLVVTIATGIVERSIEVPEIGEALVPNQLIVL